ncbi:MAG: hypothetical protein EOP50_04640 [Sphingobacteriales bacterium]|nr:MAG: hypothetical protein EOP50_04640 [Sphingobacteriales bacterium]
MRPSDKVWQGISDNLKRRNRRTGWLMGFFVVAASLSGYVITEVEGNSAHGLASRNSSLPAASDRGGATNADTQAGTDRQGIGATGAAAPFESAGAPVVQLSPRSSSTAAGNNNRNGATYANARTSRRGNRRFTHNLVVVPQTQPVSTSATETLDPESSTARTEFDRIYTDASLAEPALAIRTALTAVPGTNNGKPQVLKNLAPERLSLQFFVTPTLSYRSLAENKDFTSAVPQNNADPTTYALYNINDAVNHKPSLGLEMGVSAKYALARNLKVQGGVQFNVSRYVVQAFDNYAVQTATFAYNDGGTSTSRSNYSNFHGGRKENLQNIYFQVSSPIGIELKIAGNSRTQFGITSTIQPTYILSDRVYMLSTDYKTYAEVPWLIRRWNVNTALSTYVGYSTGKLAWQVGPQVRYQLMSSFVNKYPVKENLFDFGLRVGVGLNKGRH